jgi:hypothetical protein
MTVTCDKTVWPAIDSPGTCTSAVASAPKRNRVARLRRLNLDLMIGLMLAVIATGSWNADLLVSSTVSVESSEGEETAAPLVSERRRARNQSEDASASAPSVALRSDAETRLRVAHRTRTVAADSLSGRERLLRFQRFLI